MGMINSIFHPITAEHPVTVETRPELRHLAPVTTLEAWKRRAAFLLAPVALFGAAVVGVGIKGEVQDMWENYKGGDISGDQIVVYDPADPVGYRVRTNVDMSGNCDTNNVIAHVLNDERNTKALETAEPGTPIDLYMPEECK